MVKIANSNCLTNAFRHLLCEERKKRSFTQYQLAKKSGLTRQCISLLESGQRVPTFFSLFNLAKGFDMTVMKFVSLFMKKLEHYEQQEKNLLADSQKIRWQWF